MAGHLFWRVLATKTTNGYWSLNALEMRIVAGGANAMTAGTLTADSTFSGYPVSNVLDGSSSTFWVAGNATLPHWVQYTFATPVDIIEIAITSRNDSSYANECATTIHLQWSDDGANWTTVRAWHRDVANYTQGTQYVLPIAAPSSCAYWRFTADKTSAGFLSLSAFDMRTTPTGATLMTGGTLSVSSTQAGYPASNMTDGSSSTFWLAAGSAPPHWVQYQFASATAVAYMVATMRDDNFYANEVPFTFDISKSSDGVTFYVTRAYTRVAADWIQGWTETFAAEPATAVTPPAIYWRIQTTQPGSLLGFASLEMRATYGGSNSMTGGTISARTVDPSYPVSNLTDGNGATLYISTGSFAVNWVTYQFASAITINQFLIQARNDGFSNSTSPLTMTLLASNDGIDFTVVASFAQASWAAGTSYLFPPANAARITGTQRGYLQLANAAHYMLIEVQDATATWRDLASIGGADYVMSAVISQQLETPATAATLTIRAGKGAASIAPLMSSSTQNVSGRLLDVSRAVRVRMAVLPQSSTVTSGDYVTVFRGTIDRISTGNGQFLTLQCRDELAPILDASFDRRTLYGDGATPAQTVLQQMLTDVLGATAPTIITPTLPLWAPPGAPRQIVARRGDSLWGKLTELVDQLGWLLRYRWSGPDTSELRFFAPQRTPTAATYTLIAGEVRDVSEASLDLSGVRNSIQCSYYVGDVQLYYTAQDGASIAAYGNVLRKLIVAESRTSQINSDVAAKRMGDAILADLRISPYSHTVQTTHAFWPAESGDVIDVPADNVNQDATQRLAVINTELRLSNDGPGNSTTLQMRGAPASRGRSWLALAGTSNDPTSGNAPASTISALTVTNTGTSGTSGNIVATWTGVGLPAGGDYRCIVSGSSFIANSTTNGVTSPRTISSGVYTDGISPPGGKIGPDFVYITIDMRDSSGNVVATRSQLSAGFYHL